MRVLLTGATGFVGQNLLLQWLEKPFCDELVLWVRNRQKLLHQLANEGLNTLPQTWHVEEVRDAFRDLPELSVDAVIHTAARLVGSSAEPFLEDNVLATERLLRRVCAKHYLLLSSQAAFGPGRVSGTPGVESDLPQPITWYGKSKLAMERMVAQKFPEKNVLILRPPMVLGARDTFTLPLFKMVGFPLVPKPGVRTKRYSFIEVTDLCRAIVTALEKTALWQDLSLKTFFVCHSQSIGDTELLRGAAKVRGKGIAVLPVPSPVLRTFFGLLDLFPGFAARVPSLSADRRADVLRSWWVVDGSAFEKTFSWKANVSLDTALSRTVEWYVHQGHFRPLRVALEQQPSL